MWERSVVVGGLGAGSGAAKRVNGRETKRMKRRRRGAIVVRVELKVHMVVEFG